MSLRRRYWVLAGLCAIFAAAWYWDWRFGTEFTSRTDLHVAAELDNPGRIKKWIASGRSLDVRYSPLGNGHERHTGFTALMLAARANSLDSVKLLVESGANLYLESSDHQSAFDYAVERSHPAVVRLLWEASDKNGFRKNIQSDLLGTYLRLCDSPSLDEDAAGVALYLVQNVADPELASQYLWRVSDDKRCYRAAKLLLENGVRPSSNALVTAAYSGLLDTVALYVDHGVDVNIPSRPGYYSSGLSPMPQAVLPLVAAKYSGHPEVSEYLRQHGAREE
jgi:ankyrin repeat protein